MRQDDAGHEGDNGDDDCGCCSDECLLFHNIVFYWLVYYWLLDDGRSALVALQMYHISYSLAIFFIKEWNLSRFYTVECQIFRQIPFMMASFD